MTNAKENNIWLMYYCTYERGWVRGMKKERGREGERREKRGERERVSAPSALRRWPRYNERQGE
jgi:hypothetical protein